MGASLNSLRRYRLFLTLLVGPALVIAIVVVLIITLFGGDGETDTTADGAATPTVTTSPAAGDTPSPARTTPPTLRVLPTQTPVVVDTPTPATPAEPTATPTPAATPTPTGPVIYTVQPDDTLSGIAEQFGVSVDDIVAFNDLPDAAVIFAGQIIEIPTDPSQLAERVAERPVPASGVVIPSDGLNVRNEPNTTTSTVQYVAGGGTQLNLTGVVQELDGIRWHEVDDGNWVQSQYLELGATAAAAPAAPAAPATGSAQTAVVIPDDGLNVRNEPNTTTSTVQYVAGGGTQLNVTGVVEEIDGIRWYELRRWQLGARSVSAAGRYGVRHASADGSAGGDGRPGANRRRHGGSHRNSERRRAHGGGRAGRRAQRAHGTACRCRGRVRRARGVAAQADWPEHGGGRRDVVGDGGRELGARPAPALRLDQRASDVTQGFALTQAVA